MGAAGRGQEREGTERQNKKSGIKRSRGEMLRGIFQIAVIPSIERIEKIRIEVVDREEDRNDR